MIFQAVNSVLADLDAAGREQHGKKWESKLDKRVETLSEEYRHLRDKDRDLIDYGDIITQAAYTFMYVAGHASFISQILQKARAETGPPLFTKKIITVTSLGGGPGSELLGLVDYLEKSDEPVTKVIYWVLEKEPAWEPLTKAVCARAKKKLEVELHFLPMDVSDTETCAGSSLAGDDLVIMSFFISEVCETHEGAAVRSSLKHFLGTMSDKSLLFYNDSNAYSFYSFFNYRVNAAKGFNEFLEMQGELAVPSPKFSGTIEEYMTLTGKCPKISADALAKVLRRELS